jgi:hypothetical protein
VASPTSFCSLYPYLLLRRFACSTRRIYIVPWHSVECRTMRMYVSLLNLVWCFVFWVLINMFGICFFELMIWVIKGVVCYRQPRSYEARNMPGMAYWTAKVNIFSCSEHISTCPYMKELSKDRKQSGVHNCHILMLTIRALQFFGHENIQDENMMNTYCLLTPF